MIDGFVYFGTALQGFVYGHLLPEKGTPAAKDIDNWYAWPIAMIPMAVMGLLLSIRIWSAVVSAKSQPFTDSSVLMNRIYFLAFLIQISNQKCQ